MGKEIDVYIDVVFLENIVMNYLILWVTSRFSKIKVSSLRLFSGALVGACYVVVLFFPNTKIFYTTFAKIILSFAMIAITFTPEKAVTFFKTLAIFFISTFIFAGAAFAFIYFSQSGVFIKDSFAYIYFGRFLRVYDFNLLLFSAATVIIILRIFWEAVQNKIAKEKLLIQVKIIFEDKNSEVPALVDTGNSLHDPLTNMPVMVVEFKAIKEILPLEIQGIFEQSKEDDLASVTNIITNSTWFSRFRLIPFTSLGKENGMLIGFKPDYIEIGESEGKKGVNDVIVGIYNRALSRNESYKALLNPELIG